MSIDKKRKRVTFDLTPNSDTEDSASDTFSLEFENIFTKKRKVEKDSWKEIVHTIIEDIEDKTSTYLDHDAIIKDFKESIIKNQEGVMNRCLQCGQDMGRCNPRQLCGKTYCMDDDF